MYKSESQLPVPCSIGKGNWEIDNRFDQAQIQDALDYSIYFLQAFVSLCSV